MNTDPVRKKKKHTSLLTLIKGERIEKTILSVKDELCAPGRRTA